MSTPSPRGPNEPRVPVTVVESLRLCVVVFFAGLGYQIATLLDAGGTEAVGGLTTLWLGVALGSAIGYVLGGVLGRTTVSAVSRTERTLRDVSAEQIVAGLFGGAAGLVTGAALCWPIFFVNSPALTLPLFLFVTLTLGLLGYRLGVSRRESVLGIFGPRAGLAVPAPSPASLARVLDTSVAIDGRVLEVVRAGFLHGRMLCPTPVLAELQGLADAGDDLRRARGRRGLETLEALRREPGVDVEVLDIDVPGVPEVDAKLIRICLDRGGALLTLDTNLAKVAALAGVRVMNLHALALALRPPVVVGDEVSVLLIKAGKEPGQAVAYLDDGTMVVVERARSAVGVETLVHVTSVLTTAGGRMVFARLVADLTAEPVVRGSAAGTRPTPRDLHRV